MAYRLDSELSEKQIEADVANYFGWISPVGNPVPFRLLDIDEQLTGADKVFDQVVPIYMQFKVSEGLTRSNRLLLRLEIPLDLPSAPLNRIRAFRKKENLYDNPTLYFKLRARAKTATDFQHNILLKLANTGTSHAFYVAPLTLSKAEYEKALFSSTDRFLDYPFRFIDEVEIHQHQWISYYGLVPFLRAHISIVLHEHVASDGHYYSFSPNGTDIAWHSPKLLSSSVSRLSDMMLKIISSSFRSNMWTTPKEFISMLMESKQFDFLTPYNDNTLNDNQGVEQLVSFGKKLYQIHQIRQLLLLTTKKYSEKTKG